MAKELFAGQRKNKYKIVISKDAISRKNIAPLLKMHQKTLIISDDRVPQKIVKKVTTVCKPSTKVFKIILRHGEKAKSIQNFQKILNFLADNNFDRTDLIIAIGGGVVGDISGYVASSYLRGIQFIQIPTTLLAQVDSSVGGKTAINIDAGKNLVGAFYNPKCVLINIDYLNSLSDKQFLSGMAEVAKYAYIGNKKIKKIIENEAIKIKNKNSHILSMLIEESIKTKARIVTKDEKESGVRAILNFGHTFGHAIEAKNKFNLISHGQAVAYGMVIAGKISLLEGLINEKYLNTLITNLDKIGLDTDISKFKYQELKKYIENDKKVSEGKLNLILIDNRKAFKTNKFNPKNLQAALS